MIFASGSFSRFHVLTLTTIVAAVAYLPVTAQEQLPPRTDPPLILTDTIGMPNVEGRIDHFAIDPGGRLFVCVVGNDTVEVLETLSEKRIHTISAVMMEYITSATEYTVANSNMLIIRTDIVISPFSMFEDILRNASM